MPNSNASAEEWAEHIKRGELFAALLTQERQRATTATERARQLFSEPTEPTDPQPAG